MDARDGEGTRGLPPPLTVAPSPDGVRNLVERRQHRPPATALGFLDQLPARILLDRLQTPMLAVGLDGVLLYANPVCARMLGLADNRVLTGWPLSAVLADHADTAPRDCVTLLKATNTAIVDFSHADGFRIRTAISPPLLVRADDPVLVITITDLTELLWTTLSPGLLTDNPSTHPC